ncbi:MAG TPA: outer membrane protein assembly factor BamE [Patescibacteria group bacterium]|nr:outer membrane protein assembly factor BamE [Patescibacteria group bacterium]
MRSFLARLCITTALLAATSACSPTVDVRGSVLPPERLELVKPGNLTKSDVTALLGSPSSTSNFGDDTWYYINSKVETFAFFKPDEIERQVVQIDFDKDGKVKEVRKLGLEDGKDIATVTRETPSAGRDQSWIEQMLGNVGKFNKAKGGPGGG